jgi:hypothetical protein
MKRNVQTVMMLAAFAVILVCSAASFAQKKPIILGGYREIPVDDGGAVAAAEFAVSERSEKNEVSLELVSIHKAERQSVQGSNFRMCLEVKNAEEEEGDAQFVKVVVYRNLKQEFALRSWVVDDCGKKDE